jgi:non-ribosomal peptide synthetase component F
VELVQPPRSLAHSPIFQVTLSWQSSEGDRVHLHGLSVEAGGVETSTSKFDLSLNLREKGEALVGGLEYASALFDRQTVERYGGYLRRVLEEMVKTPEAVAAALPMLADAELRQLLETWNATEAAYPLEMPPPAAEA